MTVAQEGGNVVSLTEKL